MKRFALEAPPLGAEAVRRALEDAGLEARDVDFLAVASCTGYGAPGLDALVAQNLGMRADLGRVHIGHMGCYAAVPALAAAADAAQARGKVAVAMCLELTSLHIQPESATPAGIDIDDEQMVSHALFADAASAAVVRPGADRGLAVGGFESMTDHASAAMMSWDVTDLGFRMGLSSQVPKAIGLHVRGLVEKLLKPAGP